MIIKDAKGITAEVHLYDDITCRQVALTVMQMAIT